MGRSGDWVLLVLLISDGRPLPALLLCPTTSASFSPGSHICPPILCLPPHHHPIIAITFLLCCTTLSADCCADTITLCLSPTLRHFKPEPTRRNGQIILGRNFNSPSDSLPPQPTQTYHCTSLPLALARCLLAIQAHGDDTHWPLSLSSTTSLLAASVGAQHRLSCDLISQPTIIRGSQTRLSTRNI